MARVAAKALTNASPNEDRQARLLSWYGRQQRDLPWRQSRDPYAIWISEVILQQTRVETGLRYYRDFLQEFPTVRALAEARVEQVLGRWSGLGYYNRARNLHLAARRIVECFGGRLPSDLDALQTLPGVGRYTAGAIASIAFDQPAPVVDGNVERVLVRWFAHRGDPSSSRGRRWLWTKAAELVSPAAPGDWNQAVMELGAMICTAAAPRCVLCPVSRHCRARALGLENRIPRARKASPQRRVEQCVAVVERSGRILMVQRRGSKLMRDLWELPAVDAGPKSARQGFDHLKIEVGQPIGVVRHAITFRSIRQHIYRGKLKGRRLPANGRWVSPDQLKGLAHSSQVTKALRLAQPKK